jgi:hypothetical protein
VTKLYVNDEITRFDGIHGSLVASPILAQLKKNFMKRIIMHYRTNHKKYNIQNRRQIKSHDYVPLSEKAKEKKIPALRISEYSWKLPDFVVVLFVRFPAGRVSLLGRHARTSE